MPREPPTPGLLQIAGQQITRRKVGVAWPAIAEFVSEVTGMWNVVDRRSERSSHLESALQLLLRSNRQRGELDLIVLATTDGVVVAHDGPRHHCEEIAAYAPLLARGVPVAIDARRIRGLSVHSFLVGRQELVLAIRGGNDTQLTNALALASIKGATRILRG